MLLVYMCTDNKDKDKENRRNNGDIFRTRNDFFSPPPLSFLFHILTGHKEENGVLVSWKAKKPERIEEERRVCHPKSCNLLA